jgi:uncharacterized membrane protein
MRYLETQIKYVWNAGRSTMDLSVEFGLLAALFWGSADFVGKLSTQRIGALRTVVLFQAVGSIFLLSVTLYDIPLLWRFQTETCLAIGIGTIISLGSYCLYKSIEIGQLSTVMPVASSYPALTTLLAVCLLHETVEQIRLLGIMATIVGIVLVSARRTEPNVKSEKRVAAGVEYALLAFVSYGLGYFSLKLVVTDLGALLPTLILRTMGALIFAAPVMLSAKPSPLIREPRSLLLVVFTGVVASLGSIAYNAGLISGSVAIVSTLSGLFSAVTVALAFLILKERMAIHQLAGFIAILIGIIGCSI